jgi:thiosulfate dehydrogenase [quinone] large subunit
MESKKLNYIWASLRIAMGWMFFWSFLDKLLGLGFATAPDAAWLRGGSPTAGYLANATGGIFAAIYHAMAGSPIVDVLFMLGLLCIGGALLLGIGVQIAGYAGAALVVLMWFDNFPPAQNPLLDEHTIFALLLVGLALARAGQWVGLGKWWSRIVGKRAPWLV